ncbi:hypothetical protein EXE41_17870 [Halorubrum sp. SD690R]|nr:hypothetical protein EXE41_17870 [Halorubrum sp. SD690R]
MAKTRVSQGASGWYKITVSKGLAEAIPVLVVACGVTNRARALTQILEIRILTRKDLYADPLPPLTEHQPPRGTHRTWREPPVREFRSPLHPSSCGSPPPISKRPYSMPAATTPVMCQTATATMRTSQRRMPSTTSAAHASKVV